MAHIGILSVLDKEGVPIDMITGTSTGVVVGAFYAQGKHTGHIKELTPDLGWKEIAPLLDLSLPQSGLIKAGKSRTYWRHLSAAI
ncbi:MAG: hypothetical protein CL874_00090 [Dehalococcoidales bacterium]|jgi:NTE family protein|nr:hypothetical protein [Dehalococcoidales bacterium]|tara:strand:- start:4917 stop:5171 length:255 start_codon:yes stop_codon:yes gene_type:complete